MKIIKLSESVFHIKAKKSSTLAKIFVRFQEFYESPEFAGKYFTLKEYQKWYKKQNNSKKFTYYNDWSGFNIPSYILKPFYYGLFDPLMKNEKILLKYFEKFKNQKFYIIGAAKVHVMKHEIAHALYYTNDDYKKSADLLIEKISKKDLEYMKNVLSRRFGGYNEITMMDEIQAYLSTGYKDLFISKDFENYALNFRKNYKKFKI